MNPALYRHKMDVSRMVRTTNATTGIETPTPTVMFTAVRCLVEPLPNARIETLLGRSITARLQVTWGTADVREGDTITFQAKKYVLRDVQNSTIRLTNRSQIGVLAEILARQT